MGGHAGGARRLYTLTALLRENEERINRTIAGKWKNPLIRREAEVRKRVHRLRKCGMPVLSRATARGRLVRNRRRVLRHPWVRSALPAVQLPCIFPSGSSRTPLPPATRWWSNPQSRSPDDADRPELLDQAGFRRVFNLVNGDRAVVDALVDHSG